VPGADFAGTVETVGSAVTGRRPGDTVFGGSTSGALAEYLCVRDTVAPKPANLTFEQAAAVPTAAVTALQGLRDKGHIRPGQAVLINGASGGVGTFAVQLAKAFGAAFVAKFNRQDFLVLGELLEAGKVTPVIDRRYALGELPEALRYLGEGHARGKVVITV
jgi:NADPH:quinone reductase-like Zn-dependent oxidoreductase